MAMNPRLVSDVLAIMRVALGRRNANDPDSSNALFLSYLEDFATLTMTDDVKLFENFGTLEFTIDGTTNGVYTFNDVGSGIDFSNISQEAFISVLDPVDNSVSWNQLSIYQNPGEFFSIWGINNDDVLIPGYPTMMLYYGNEFTFRTIPNTEYLVKIYGYKINDSYSTYRDPVTGNPVEAGNAPLQFNYWLRYLAYGAALNYARDYRYEPSVKAELKADFAHERKQLLTRTHNQIKLSRSLQRF